MNGVTTFIETLYAITDYKLHDSTGKYQTLICEEWKWNATLVMRCDAMGNGYGFVTTYEYTYDSPELTCITSSSIRF